MIDTYKILVVIGMFIITNLLFIVYDKNFGLYERGVIKWKVNLIISLSTSIIFLLLG